MPESVTRPLKDKTVAELVHMFNDKCLAARRLGAGGASARFDEDGDGDYALPSTFLKDPASEATIDELERKVRAAPYNFSDGLPADYVEFLKVSNGIYAHDRAASQDEIFRPVSEVELEEGSFL